jgi:hypothetical protein
MTTPLQNQRVLMTRIKKIEQKQAERFPHLIERLDRIEQSIVALQNAAKNNKAAIHDRSGKRWSKR